MIIIPLIEDSRVRGYQNEKGLSLYIETENKKIIFDFGKSNNFIKNANNLGIDMGDIDIFIASHGHSDHFNGLSSLDTSINSKRVFYAKEVKSDLHFNSFGLKKDIGSNNFPFEGISFNDTLEIDSNIYLIKSPITKLSNNFYRNGKVDDFSHEIHLVIVEDSKINVITGCCHSGIFNLLDRCRERFPNKDINSLIGGIHTRSYIFRPLKLVKFLQKIKKYNISSLVLGHCTGRLSLKIFSIFLKGISRLKIGKSYFLG